MMMMIRFLTLLVAAAVSISERCCYAAGTNSTPRFHQDQIAIGFWVDPPADDKMDERYADIAKANFTFVLGVFNANTTNTVQKQLALCQKYGLKAVVSMAGLPPERLPGGRTCWGYFVADEPGPAAFPSLRKTLDSIHAAKPGKMGFINLLPDYAPAWAFGGKTYAGHVEQFISEVHPDILSMDYYPHFKPDADGRDGYCGNLEVMRQESLKAGIPFWNFFNTMPFGDHSDPTEAQLRWQVFMSLAYGAKGILYFCYWTPQSPEFPKGGAILRADGTKTHHYEEAKRINAVVRNYGPTLMQLTNTAVIRLKPGEKYSAMLTNSPIKSLSDGDYLIGSFRHKDGRRAVLLNNYHFAYSAWATVEFNAPTNSVVEIDAATGKEVPLYDDSPDMPGVQISLDAGQGRLFLMPATAQR
jgi:hypothetical protein